MVGGSSDEEVPSGYGNRFLADGGGHGGDSSEECGHGGDSSEEGDSTPQGSSSNNTVPSTRSDPPGALLYDSDWNGEATGTDLHCEHGYVPQKKFQWTEDGHCGRRFLGCPMEDDEDEQCKFVHWIDDAWAPRVQKTLRHMWVAIRHSTTEASKADKEKKIMEEKLQRTEATKTAMLTVYEGRVQTDAEDKKKGWVLSLCLVGVIVAMLYLVLLPKLAK
ncbi:hypothetical protein ACP70R_001525 [Stipagrostis hirtigluma subsp. patula]